MSDIGTAGTVRTIIDNWGDRLECETLKSGDLLLTARDVDQNDTVILTLDEDAAQALAQVLIAHLRHGATP